MNPADRERVKDLLVRAAGLPPPQRRALIESANVDREVIREALDLLSTLDDSAFLSAPTGAGFSPPGSTMLPGEQPGAKVGRYKLLQLIGEGGFGSVFMAEQTEPVHRRVALKIIKAGMDTKQVIARFEAERQALALMDHPNIARVLDAGATDSARPFFVMELVRGDPMTRYCDREELSVRRRLELFNDVCNAVQHAHQKGIIHRDLKPSNVLVTVSDGEPLPKVIDFGIAKATFGRLTNQTLFTEMHQLIGTPEYMSPEQAEASGVDIDTRSDIYSLGVMLYELLVGGTPLEGEKLRSTPFTEIQRLIREGEPQRPSLRLGTMIAAQSRDTRFWTPPRINHGAFASSAVEIARRRRSEPALLTRSLRGDLDWIVMKCLEKDRSRRYATASALADDVGRYLGDQPVLATPPSRSYKLRKFARRNKSILVGVAAVFLMMVLGTIGSTVGYLKATEAEKLALEKSEESSRAAAKAAAVSNFLQEMLSSVDPTKLGKEVTIRQALDDAAAKVESGSLKEQPALEADLRSAMGTTYLALGHYPEAEEHLRHTLELRRNLSGDDATADLAADLGNLADVANAQGHYREQEAFIRECLAIQRRVHTGDHRDVAGAEQGLAAALRVQGKLGEAEPHYRAALDMRRRLFGPVHEDVGQSLNSLALLAQNLRNYVGAERLFREALDIRRKTLGDAHPVVADALNNLANLIHTQARHKEAEPLLREALEMRIKVLGPEHPAVAQSMNNLASVLLDQKDPVSAEPLYRGAWDVWRKTLPADHPNIPIAGNGLASTLLIRMAFSEAEPILREILIITESRKPVDEYLRLGILSNLGESLTGQGRFDEAEKILLETYGELTDKYPKTLRRKETGARLLWLYKQWNRPDDAATWQAELDGLAPPTP